MPRPKTRLAKIRLTLEVTVDVKRRMEKIRDKIHADSLTEVIRRSLLFYEAAIEAKERVW